MTLLTTPENATVIDVSKRDELYSVPEGAILDQSSGEEDFIEMAMRTVGDFIHLDLRVDYQDLILPTAEAGGF